MVIMRKSPTYFSIIFAFTLLCCNGFFKESALAGTMDEFFRLYGLVADIDDESPEFQNPKTDEDSLSFAKLKVSDIINFDIKEKADTSLLGHEYASLDDFKHSLKMFVVSGCIASYDYNADGTKDALYMIQGVNESQMSPLESDSTQIVNKNPRGLVLLLSDGKKFKVAMENDTCFYSEYEDGGVYFFPELDLATDKDGNITVEYHHGRYGYWIYRFKYDNGDFRLTNIFKDESASWIAESLSFTSIDIDSCLMTRQDLINTDEMVNRDSVTSEPLYSKREKRFSPIEKILLSRICKVF